MFLASRNNNGVVIDVIIDLGSNFAPDAFGHMHVVQFYESEEIES